MQLIVSLQETQPMLLLHHRIFGVQNDRQHICNIKAITCCEEVLVHLLNML